ncbi:hypothetical protein FRC03_006701 [Tulasnella sp. 419]|nr:hypothetical protein FRC03_006701 [Tulasnella sp. 419]
MMNRVNKSTTSVLVRSKLQHPQVQPSTSYLPSSTTSMTDVRALLKAKTKEREPQIQHPYAVYSAAGQLRCSLCGTTIKHSSAWKPHLDGKVHRANELKEQEKAAKKGKRKVESEGDPAAALDEESKKRKFDTPPPSSEGFPSDFFSDPSRSLPQPSQDEDDEEDNPTKPDAPTSIDSEWEAFERAISAPKRPITSIEDAFNRATIFAEPELVNTAADGFPPGVAGTSEGDAQSSAQATSNQQGAETEEAPVETEAEKQRRKVQEDKELIMDRLLDEERAQEEADDKVRSLKARLEAIKKQREASRAKKMEVTQNH